MYIKAKIPCIKFYWPVQCGEARPRTGAQQAGIRATAMESSVTRRVTMTPGPRGTAMLACAVWPAGTISANGAGANTMSVGMSGAGAVSMCM